MDKKIGIITFHNADNYGSVLQAYALNKYIRNHFSDNCYIINYRSENQKKQYDLYLRNNSIKNILKNIYIFFKLKKVRFIQKENFENFRKKNLFLYPQEASSEIENLQLCQYDTIICGSDQIWNIRASDFSFVYMLDGIEVPHKISYAASMGGLDLKIDDIEDNRILNLLNNFSAISVRENIAKVMLEKCGLNNISINFDPTFLLTENEWKIIMSKRLIEKDYLFFYSVDYNPDSVEIAKWYGEKLGMPVVYMHTSFKSYFISDKGLEWAGYSGVEDFLSLIFYSKAVLSGSFHGTVFSLIFNKPFYRIQRKSNSDNVIDDRVVTLLGRFNLMKREINIINYKSCVSDLFNINFDDVNKIIETERKNSEAYLSGLLNDKTN